MTAVKERHAQLEVSSFVVDWLTEPTGIYVV